MKILLVGAVAAVLTSGAARAQTYSVQVLEPFPTYDTSTADRVNNLGQVAGLSSRTGGSLRTFFFDGSTVIDLLPGEQTLAQGINDNSDVAVNLSNYCHQALLITGDGQRLELGTRECDGAVSEGLNTVYAVNSSRQAVGFAHSFLQRHFIGEHAAIWDSGNVTDLGTLGGGTSIATAINESGMVAGWSQTNQPNTIHPFLYADGQMQDLGTLGGQNARATAINGDGLVVGSALTAGDEVGTRSRAFLYDGSQMNDLGTLPGSDASWATSINSSGWVVGYASTNAPDGGTTSRGFLYDGNSMMDLNDLVAGSGWLIVDARSINDAGQIAAVAAGFEDGRSVIRAVLLNPN